MAKTSKLDKIIEELQNASKMHLRQSKELNKMESPVKNTLLTGENTSEIKTDDKGEYSLVLDETQEGLKTGDTIRPADNKLFKPFVRGKSQGSKDGYLIGGDYNVEKTGDKNYDLSPTNRNKFGGTPDNTDKQAAYEKATEELYAEGKITETDDKAVKLIKRRVKKNAKKLI
tara:strand:+ start:195 stop:710 length:516 start_codon:yes stop_codon:yes gene_type:complete